MEQQTIKTPKNTAALQPKAAGAVAKKKGSSVVEYLNDAKFQAQIAAALPKFMDTDSFVRNALTDFRKQPLLQTCSVPSVLGYYMQAAACGLMPGVTLGQCYAVPFRNKNTGQMECEFIIGYRGMLAIARRSGEIASVSTYIVHEKDEFSLEYGLEPKLVHKPYPDADDAGPMKGVYCVVRFKGDGVEPVFEYMPKSEVDKHRKRSKAGSTGPWVTDYEAMARKTVFRTVFKWLPISIEQIQATTTDGGVSRYNPNAQGDSVDDLVEVEFVASSPEDEAGEMAEEAPVGVDEAVEKMAEQMKV